MNRSETELAERIERVRAELDQLDRLDGGDKGGERYPFRDRRSVNRATRLRGQALASELEELTRALAHLRCACCDAAKDDHSSADWCSTCESSWQLEVRRFGAMTPNEDRNGVLSWAAPTLCLVAVPTLAALVSAGVAVVVLVMALVALFAVVYQVVPANTPPSRDRFRDHVRQQHLLPRLGAGANPQPDG